MQTTVDNAYTRALREAVSANMPIMVSGSVGVGKTAGAVSLFKSLGFHTEVLVLALREPVDLLGAMLANPVAGQSSVLPPEWAVRAVNSTKPVVIIIDEFSTAPVAMQHASLRIVNERYVGDLYLDPAHVAIVVLTNPAAMAQGHDLTLAMGSRFAHVEYQLNVVEWCRDFEDYWGENPEIKTTLGTVPADVYRQARRKVSRFLKSMPELIAPPQLDADAENGIFTKPFPTPRTWDAVARFMAVAIHEGRDPAAQKGLIEGTVGEGPAKDLFAFLEGDDLPDPQALLRDPDSYEHSARNDRARTVLISVARACAADPTPASWLAAWKILAQAARVSGTTDVAVNAALILSELDSSNLPSPPAADMDAFNLYFEVARKFRA